MKKILVAYDGSETSQKAIKEVEELLVQHLSVKVCLLSVFHHPKAYSNVMMPREIKNKDVQRIQKTSEMKEKEAWMNKVNAQLEDFQKYLKAKGVEVDVEGIMVNGKSLPGEKICEYAEKNNFDMIVVGSRGLGNIKKYVLGSVSDYVIKHATVPVLVVK